jgi:prepilin-type N-terminal cleavage/methylation domain-containing protein
MMRSARGFTLVELLMVVLIIGVVSGMVVFMPRGDQRRANVEAAANELAETMRLAHNLALDHRAIYALVFNITNAPGTSGLVLNNWSGGHWYQILGPDDSPITLSLTGWTMNNNGEPMCPYPFFIPQLGENLSSFLAGVKSSWVGDRHILPARKVRFLALTDEDNGGCTLNNNPGFVNTYPRFWFGWYDNTTNRLRPWGGYDTQVPGKNGTHSSGFFYEGFDGPITGCINPVTYATTDATPGSQLTPGGPVQLLTAGKSRPLVNGDWMDYAILFLPDGTIRQYHFCAPRLVSWTNRWWDPAASGNGDLYPWSVGQQNPPGDNGQWYNSANASNDNVPFSADPATSFFDRTGYFFITLAPDVDQDSDSFGNVDQAYASIMPAYRVGVSAIGNVEVFPVHTTLLPGTQLDATFSSTADWTNPTTTSSYYQNNELTNADGSPRGTPIYDRLTTTMMQTPQCWSIP